MKSFDRIADSYEVLERLAFGGDLERTRSAFLPTLRSARSVLLLGDGDGRFLCDLLREAPLATVVSVDKSPRMVERARERLRALGMEPRVQFVTADARNIAFESGRFDAVTTLFFLDCFGNNDCQALCASISRILAPEGAWLFADFVIPESGWRRFRSRAWLTLLYTFFRLATDLQARALPDSREHIRSQGFEIESSVTLQQGLLQSSVYRRKARNFTAKEAAKP